MYKPADHDSRSNTSNESLEIRRPSHRFSYRKFNDSSSQIRLLRLLPSDPLDKLRCALDAHFLTDKPLYSAASYEWGDNVAGSGITIIVDEQEFSIGHNLWRLLDYLQHRKQGSIVADHALIWVDAICIDQHDLEEKAAQVRLMSRIFGQADQVFAWLGQPSSFDAQKTFDFIHAVAFRAKSEDSLETARWAGLIPEDPSRGTTQNGLRPSDAWRSILGLCRENYWNRRWVIQEVISAHDPTLLCVGGEISWSALQTILNFVDEHLPPFADPSSERHRGIRPSWWQTLRKIEGTTLWKIYRLRAQLRASDTAPSLKTLMIAFTGSRCHLLHDRAYALLNLTRERNIIDIKYSCAPFELFKEIFTRAHQYSGRDWPKQLMKILELDKDIVPLPRPSHRPIIPVKLAARQLMCISHVFRSSSKGYLREMSQTGQKIQDQLGTRKLFEQHYRIPETKHRRGKWKGNYLVHGSSAQLSEVQRWTSVASSWPSRDMDKRMTIVRNIEDTCPAQINDARLVMMNNGGLAYAIGEVNSGDIVLPILNGVSAVLMRCTGGDDILAVGAVILGSNMGEKWPELVCNWYTLGVKRPPVQYLRREEPVRDDGSMTLFVDAACFIGMYRYGSII